MATLPNRKMKFKLNIIVLGFLSIGFFFLCVRTIYIAFFGQIDGLKYGVKARNRQMSSVVIRANRGTIYDRNMVPLAQSATVWVVTISPNQFKSQEQKDKVAHDLFNMLELDDFNTMYKRFKSKRKYEIIKKNVEKPKRDELLKYIKKNKLHNIVNTEEDTKRYYPLKSIGSHTIGFVGADNQGLLGLELFYNKLLSGENGKMLRVQDAKGGPMPYEFENLYPAKNGKSIVISIDSVIQRICSEALADLFKWHKPNNRCLAIVMDIKTGEIVGLCVHPEFDLNDPFTIPDPEYLVSAKDLPDKEKRAFSWSNKAVSENYEPGSVFKVLTASAALEEKTQTLDSNFVCTGSVKVQGRTMKCWKHEGHGSQNFTQACVNSCNPAFVAIGNSLGPSKFFKYLELFGITRKTRIDLPGETDPLYYKEKDLNPVTLASESFGQSLSITPMQMISTFSAVVNGGFLNTPHILKQVLDNKGNIIKTINKKATHQVISRTTSDQMRSILTEVVKGPEGTGTNSSVPGYSIAGKTGTAQKLEETRKTGKDVYVGSFAGLLTADNPTYAVIVLCDSPTQGKYYGSDVASPTFNRIALKIASYLGMPSKFTKEQYDQFFNKIPACEGLEYEKAKEILEKEKFKNIKLIGDKEDKIIAQFPSPNLNVEKDSKVYLYTDEEKMKENLVEVPDLTDLSYSKAKQILSDCGLNMVCENMFIKKNDSSTAISQFPEKGSNLIKGSVVEVNFRMYDGTG